MSFSPWIKIEATFPDKPEVIAIATRLKMRDSDTATGKLVRLLVWADANSVDGTAMTITRAFIDRLVSCKGFAAALTAVGWLTGEDGNLTLVNFERHNGESAKKRAVETRKKQNQRAGQKEGKVKDKCPDTTGTNVPSSSGQDGGPEEEIEIDKKESECAPAGVGTNFAELALRVVSHYPRREKFNAAIVIVESQLRQGEDGDAMIAGTKAIAEVIKELPAAHNNRFVPSAETFFRLKRWQDDPQAFRRDATPAHGSRDPASVSDEAVRKALGGRA